MENDTNELDNLSDDAVWLEDSHHGAFSRYMTGVDERGDGISSWYCTRCGAQVSDPDDGCCY